MRASMSVACGSRACVPFERLHHRSEDETAGVRAVPREGRSEPLECRGGAVDRTAPRRVSRVVDWRAIFYTDY